MNSDGQNEITDAKGAQKTKETLKQRMRKEKENGDRNLNCYKNQGKQLTLAKGIHQCRFVACRSEWHGSLCLWTTDWLWE